MSKQRFIVESVMIDCLCKDKPRIAKVITDTDENYSYGDLYEIKDLMNEQQATITGFQEKIFELRDDKEQLHTEISKLRQEVSELKTRNAVLSSKLNQIPKSIKEVWLE